MPHGSARLENLREVRVIRTLPRSAPQTKIGRVVNFLQHERAREDASMNGVVPEVSDNVIVAGRAAVGLIPGTGEPVSGEERAVDHDMHNAGTRAAGLALDSDWPLAERRP